MSASYDRVVGGKLKLKGGEEVAKAKQAKKKKTTKRKKREKVTEEVDEGKVEDGAVQVQQEEAPYDIGTGHAPDGKKSKKYEELFPVEAARFEFQGQEVKSREAALDERIKKKADRYCK